MDRRRSSALVARSPRRRLREHRQAIDDGPPAQRCEDRRYIQSWLNELDRDADPESGSLEERPWHPHNIVPSERKRSVSSEDNQRPKRPCSLLESPLQPFVESQDGHSSCDGNLPGPPSSASEKENRYAKRARRKTKDDRYDTKRAKAKGEGRQNATRKPRRRKDRKQDLRSGKKAMQNFSSNAISNDRVTIKPSFTTGLFSNGRASGPAHVTDLTFNNMDFLARQSRSKYREHHNDSKEKRRQKVSKEVQDEADFFDQRNANIRRAPELREFSPLFTQESDKQAEEHLPPKRLQGEELQRLKLPTCRKRPSSTPPRAKDTPSLPFMPRRTHSDATYISWSTSPASARRKEQKRADSVKETTTSGSAARLSAIKRLIRTGVFDFANASEPSASAPGSDHTRDESHDEQQQYKEETNGPSTTYPLESDPRPEKPLGHIGRSDEPGNTQPRSIPISITADKRYPFGMDANAVFLVPGAAKFDERGPTFDQLRPTRSHNLQTSAIEHDEHRYWRGPRLPQILPTLAEVSQEISDAEQLGQSWNRYEKADTRQYETDSFQHMGPPSQRPWEAGHQHETPVRREPMAEYIARLESEILGRDSNDYELELPYADKTRHDYYSQDLLPYQEQPTTDAQRAAEYQAYQGQVHNGSYDEAEMTAFWRPNHLL